MERMLYRIRNYGYLWGVIAVIIAFCLTGCQDDEMAGSGAPFDSGKPVAITDFTPKSGGYGSNLIIYGDNFGNDVSRVRVTVGGKEASVIHVNGTSLYC